MSSSKIETRSFLYIHISQFTALPLNVTAFEPLKFTLKIKIKLKKKENKTFDFSSQKFDNPYNRKLS